MSRMADGSLPKRRIVADVRDYTPVGDEIDAECVAGGFPCQVMASEMKENSSMFFQQNPFSHPLKRAFEIFLSSQSSKPKVCSCQGVSQAGDQAGIRDDRSSLVKEGFNTYDKLRNPCAAEYSFCSEKFKMIVNVILFQGKHSCSKMSVLYLADSLSAAGC